jgi:hypothetical protein
MAIRIINKKKWTEVANDFKRTNPSLTISSAFVQFYEYLDKYYLPPEKRNQ